MDKIQTRQVIDRILKDNQVFCPVEVLFYLDGKTLALSKKDRLVSEMSLSGLETFLNEYPQMEIIAFNLNYKWDRVAMVFDNSDFVKTLPEVMRTAKKLTILPGHDRDRAAGHIELIRKKEFTGFYPLTDPQHNEAGAICPGVSYIYTE